MLFFCYLRTECLCYLSCYLLLLGVFFGKLCSRDHGMQVVLQVINSLFYALVHTVCMYGLCKMPSVASEDTV